MSDLDVRVTACNRRELLAIVAGVRVRVRRRRNAPPKWLCDAHPDPAGRTACEHTEALAATVPTPTQLARASGQQPQEGTIRD